jgi:pyruvate formate lyase activating enzyme
MVEIKGLIKFAPKDFAGFISSTVFLGGCNFRCPFCHNSDLVLKPQTLPTFSMDYFISYLDSRKGWLEGVCVSGGEPLIHEDLQVLLALIKERNLLVKIDTNGSLPQVLEELIQRKLIDQVAMDVKAPLDRYHEACGAAVRPEDILKSIEIIKNSGLAYLFRTTAVPGLVGAEDIRKIGEMLDGAKLFQVQQFQPENTIDRNYLQARPYSSEELLALARSAEPYFAEIRIEGI